MPKTTTWGVLACIFLLGILLLASVCRAEKDESFLGKFKDPHDGKFDIVGAKEMTSGFLPVIIPFNEPAVGLGAVFALAYFHPQDPGHSAGPAESPAQPPSISFGGGLYSENKTWAVAGGHFGVWNDGRLRYLGGAAYASTNLDFYGIGNDPDRNRDPIPFNVEGGGFVQQLEHQLGDSRFFLGLRYEFASTFYSFGRTTDLDEVDRKNNAGLLLMGSYDSRNNIFTPETGMRATAYYAHNAPGLGGQYTYNRFHLRLNRFWLCRRRLVIGLRLEYQYGGRGAPFYALPWVRLRGIPALRYLGHHVLLGEVEPRWKLDERWSILAFGGLGRAALEFDSLSDAEDAYNYGAGFRYLIARKLGLAMGLDIARGPEETSGYITVGGAW